ncbi:unnamed protein product [Leptidea sinapis]|uniref:Major facilitator superfamily (MFS) profile domain-containing protein n=1 Tax=Leptidea sinapis TaxID=189913 RepID=A0A5E4QJE2_9NEOP|nr:unnamed protein product [Leptidea sinapis]
MEEKVNQNNEREQFTESDPLKENGGEFKEKKSFKENFLYAVKNVTVEPVMICYVVSCVLAILTGQNLNLEKACRVNLNFTKDICDSLKSQTLEAENEYERDVQILVARAMAWRTLITATLPCITALFVGSWSDKTGYRKIFIIIPIIGQTLSCFNGILHYYFFFELSLEAYVFSDALIDGLSGSFCVCFLTIFSYISTITTVENRTFRLGLINFSMSVGFPIGMGLSGVLLKYSGFYSVYSFCAVIHVLNFLYTVFILKDPKRDEGQKQHDKKGLVHLTRLYFDIANIKNTLLVVFKRGSNNRRTIISVAIFSKWLRWHDAVLGIFSTISKIASSFVYCFAQNERILYLVSYYRNNKLLQFYERQGDKDNIDESSPLINYNDVEYIQVKDKNVRISKKIEHVIKNITVEPILACYIMPKALELLAIQNLSLDKVCRVNLNFKALTARNVQNYTKNEEEVQTVMAGIQAWKNVIQTIIPVFIILFVGAWSDRTGKRKFCILMPILGELLSSIGLIINTYLFYELPAEVVALTESVFPAFTGGFYTVFLGIFSYISDITTTHERTYRIGIVILCSSIGHPLGIILSGIMLKWIGYYGVFLISAGLYLFSLIYGLFFLRDPEFKSRTVKSCGNFFKEIFDVNLVKETFTVLLKNGSKNRRLRVCLLLVSVFLVYGPIQGENTMMYLFFRYRFNWAELEFSCWSSYRMITHLIGKMSSLFGVAEAMTPMIYGPLYSAFYIATFKVLPVKYIIISTMAKLEAIVLQNYKIEGDKEEVTESSPLKVNNVVENIKVNAEKQTFAEKIKHVIKNISVEPILACYIMPSVLSSLAIQNLNLDKVCRVNLNFSNEICEALKARNVENYTKHEEEVQTVMAGIQAWKNVIQTVIPVLIILFVGAWSDKTGRRKACILMPIFGEMMSCIGFIVNTYFFYELPAEVAALTECIFPAFTGGWYTNYIGIFSYISDITTVEDRTYRVGIVNLCSSLGYPIGSALSGIMLKWFGYYGVFSVSAALYLFSILYGYFCLRDPEFKREKVSNKGCCSFFTEFFDLNLAKETFSVAFKTGSRKRRLRLCLLLLSVWVVFGPLQGEFAIMYLFVRYRFNWAEMEFSWWCSYSMITNLIGTTFSISLFSKYLKLDDTILGIISSLSKIAAAFAYAFARTNFEIYMAPLLEILNGTSFIAMRAIATKLVDSEEIGKVNSLFGLAEAMTPLLYGPLYSSFYIATFKVLPGGSTLHKKRTKPGEREVKREKTPLIRLIVNSIILFRLLL